MTGPARETVVGFSADGALSGGALLERENPARLDETVGEIVCTPTAAVGAAVGAGVAAQPSWAALDPTERAEAVLRGARSMVAAESRLAPLLARELGKPLPDSAGEMGFAAAWSEWVARHVGEVCEPRVVDDDLGRLEVRRVPVGVVAAIVPWNAPLILSMLKVAPALATGNTIVVKPSPVAPFSVTAALELLAAQLPAGVISVVHGGADVGTALVGDPRIAKVAFTGGEAVAKSVLMTCAQRITPTVMELGGNDAALVLDDLSFDDATMDRLVFGAFLTTGQVCMAAKRLLVPSQRLDQFIEAFVAAARRVLIGGDPLDHGVTIGPVATASQRTRVTGLVEDARSRGAHILELGTTTASWDPAVGYFVRPTLVLDAPPDAPIVVEEQFGPTVPVLAYDDLDDAIGIANSTEFGLASSVWSEDPERAFTVGARIRAGTTFINCHNREGMSLRAPFGGVGRSGWGREFAVEGIEEYTRTHALHLPASARDPELRRTTSANAYPAR